MTVQPYELGLMSWRPGQYQAIQNSRTSKKRFVGQCAPVGSGKSHILLGEALESGARTLILTGSKELQLQYARLFAHLNILDIQGKSNYACKATEVGGEFHNGTPAKSVADGPCQFGEECGLRLSGCTYYDKVARAKYARIVSTNYAAWISANLFTEGWGKFDLVLADEAHEAEDWLARMLAVRLPRCYANLSGAKMPNTTNVAMWVNWARRELPMVRAAIRLEKKALMTAKRKKMTKLRTLQSMESSLVRMSAMTYEWKVFPEKAHVLFQPIWVHDYAESLLFYGADKVVFASSTMVPNTLNLLGVTDNDFDFFSYPSTFPPERRPIYYHPVIKMRHGLSDAEEQEWVNVVDNFISKRLDRKGIIHTVSYARQNSLLKYSKYASLMVASSASSTVQGANTTSSAKLTLQRFRMSPAPCVLIGPNWSTGIDLKYKDAQYTIIPKIQFPDITDPLYIARSEDNPDYGWYYAGMKFTQSIGRAMRAADDLNETLVTDSMFGVMMSRYRRMIPDWVWSAVRKTPNLPEPLEALV
jgi:Rad3-related DNA helicase